MGQTLEQGLYYYFPDQKDLAIASVRYQAFVSSRFDGDSQPVSVYVYDASDLSNQKNWSLDVSYYTGFTSATPYIPSVSVKVIDGKTVGIKDVQKESTLLTVFPNPVTDNLHLNIKTEQAGAEASFILTDIAGRIIHIENGILQNNMTYSVSMKGLPAGNYLIHVRTANSSVSKNIVKY